MIKKRIITLDGNVKADETKLTLLNQIEGVIECAGKKNALIIKYDLNRCDYQTVFTELLKYELVRERSGLDKIKHTLIIDMESNERDYAEIPSGWNYYVQRLYLSLDNISKKTK